MAEPRTRKAFTLVELILVMARLLVVFMALVVPDVARSLRQRNLEQEAARLLALTEYGRDEAASQGVPMDVWIDPASKSSSAWNPRPGTSAAPRAPRPSSSTTTCTSTPSAAGSRCSPARARASHAEGSAHARRHHRGEFAPDGTLDPTSVASIRIADRKGAGVSVTQTADGYGYQIVKDAAP